MNVEFIKLKANGIIPTKNTPQSAGFDMYSPLNYTILPGERKVIETNIRVVLPGNTYGNITARSGLAARFGIIVAANTIDRDYEGGIAVILINLGQDTFEIKEGDRISQLVVIPYVTNNNVDTFKQYRGIDGLGSSGR